MARNNVTMTQRIPNEDRLAQHNLPEPGEWLDRYGDSLYRFALARLYRPHDAEEAVQEALLAAFQGRKRFAGRSHPRTWLLGILKRTVQNRLRAAARRAREVNLDDLDAWFDARGKWRRPLGSWDNPANAAERSEFWAVLRRCLGKLPARVAAAFTLRTMDELDPSEVCRELSITHGNLWVLLHRARLSLVRCLQVNWFGTERGP
jgi:RNA polymerase sigma-70 factor (ECF subfamily)